MIERRGFISRAAEIFYLDVRSLAVFRICLGSVILYNLFTLWPDRDAFLGPQGIYPSFLCNTGPDAYLRWTFHSLCDRHWYIDGLLILNGIFALMLFLGAYTRLATCLCWVMAISLVHRNPLIMEIGRDYALMGFLMWGMFLPLGAHFSIDASVRNKRYPAERVLSVAGIGLMCYLAMIYLQVGWLKTHPVWTTNHLALNYAFGNYIFVKPLGAWLLQFPDLLKALTAFTLFIERFAVVTVFSPFRPALFRSILIGVFCAFHMVLYMTMRMEWFSFIMITAWCALIPSSWWRSVKSPAVQVQKNISANIIAMALLVWVVFWNVGTVRESLYNIPRSEIFKLSSVIGLSFPWRLFCPSPPLTARHITFVPVFDRPELLPQDPSRKEGLLQEFQLLNNEKLRWRYLATTENKQLMPFLTAYAVRRWNAAHPELLVKGTRVDIKDEVLEP